jgi:hypothetical protein
LIAIVGYLLMLGDLIAIVFFSGGLAGPTLILLGALTGLSGSVTVWLRRPSQGRE